MAKAKTTTATVTCEECGHDAELTSEPSTWKCSCHAGFGADGCGCDHTNYVDTSNVAVVVHTDPDPATGATVRREVDLAHPPDWYNADVWTVEAD